MIKELSIHANRRCQPEQTQYENNKFIVVFMEFVRIHSESKYIQKVKFAFASLKKQDVKHSAEEEKPVVSPE